MQDFDLIGKSGRELAQLLASGHALTPDELAGWTYRGISLGLPKIAIRLSWLTFAKAFVADAGGVRGWNVRLQQTGLDSDVLAKEKHGKEWTFGHFRVAAGTEDCPRLVGPGVTLDYSQGGNPWWEAFAPMRDPLVCLRPGDPTLLLGWSYARLGPLRLPTPSYFVLRRWAPVTHVPPVPRPPRLLGSPSL